MLKSDIMSFSMDELCQEIANLGEKSFRAKQIYEWLHIRFAAEFSDVTNLSKDLRDKLNNNYVINMPKIVEVYKSKIDGTRKYLFELYDGNIIESVLMKYKHGNSVCISSQVGCRMGCKFCASTIDGLERNLLPSEMLGQIYAIQKDLGERVSNVVIMGSG
jgi:23S rRNA (adenine2503-C2)-methyltransferase